jgi:protein-S-isoprenylcysteine O-methyltransferase Ste14
VSYGLARGISVAVVALVSYAVYLALAFGLRSLLHLRRTGSTGFKGVSGRVGSAEWIAGMLFMVALLIGVAAPLLALVGLVGPLSTVDRPAVHIAGMVLFGGGLLATLLAQLAMGASWRIGVDADERTSLVTDGPFSWVRNPIFSAMLPTSVGLALMVPSGVALAGVATLALALELQVRVVEEPYLAEAHGQTYGEYAARVGRFVPGLGKLSRP